MISLGEAARACKEFIPVSGITVASENMRYKYFNVSPYMSGMINP